MDTSTGTLHVILSNAIFIKLDLCKTHVTSSISHVTINSITKRIMATYSTCGWSLRDFYNNSSLGEHIRVGNRGNESTAPQTLVERTSPRLIVEDKDLRHRLVNFAKHRLTISSPDTPHYFHGVHETTERSFIGFRLGEEARNLDSFTLNANYVREFVATADELQLGDIETIPC